MNCPNCQTLNPEGARFCFNCGSALPVACSNCGTSLQPGARFCHNCGQPVSPVQAPVAAPPGSEAATRAGPTAGQPARISEQLQRYIPRELLSKLEAARSSGLMEGERRVVTILFCDVKGSTLAASNLDPEEWAEIINGAFAHMIGPIYRYEGTVARLQGDGLLAFFGAPIAHEDDPQRAVLAGLDMVEAIRTYGQGVKERWGIDFNVRVGINTGLVVVGAVGSDLRVEYSALGDAINMAARMEQTAEPGAVQVAEATHKLVAPLFDFEVIEGLEVKGKDAPVSAYRALGRKTEPGSLRGIVGLQSPLIGRQAQMAALSSALAELKQGCGQVVSVIGEAGLGKSRLIADYRQASMAEPGLNLQWLEGRALSYETSMPFAPFINLFNRFFELLPGDSDGEKFARIGSRLESLFPGSGAELAPFFASLQEVQLEGEAAQRVQYLEPPHLRGLIFSHVAKLAERLATAGCLVLFLDDLHWADPTSLELLQSLLPLTESAPVMILTAFRPQRQEASWAFHENVGRDYYHRHTSIDLAPLDEGQARQLVANLLHIEDLPEQVRRKILEKSEGNPFFVEEIIRSLLDSGLVVSVDGHWQATREINHIRLPDTLAGVITARLDRLDEPSKHLVQAAAVLGREFSPTVLADIVEIPGGLETALVELQRREMVREISRIPQPTFSFKHVLTQETAYNSILLSNRRELHRRAAESLIARTPEAFADIGRHLVEARQAGRAMPYLVQAGERAAKAYATQEAIAYFRQALELKSSASDQRMARRAYEGLGRALQFANRIPEAQETLQEMLELAEATNDVPMQISALNKLGGLTALVMGNFQEADQLLARAESLSRQHADRASLPETALIRCQMCTVQADFTRVIEYMDEVVQIGEEMDSPEHVAMGLEHVASSLIYLTQFEEAFGRARQGLKVAREIGDREHEAWLLSFTLPFCYLRDGEFEAARSALESGLEIGTMIGQLSPQAVAAYLLAEVARWQGEYEKALSYGQRSLEAALPLEAYMPFFVVPALGSLGMVYLEVSEEFNDKVSEFHLHALRLLETPAGAVTGGTAWADLGYCAIVLGDLKIAAEVIQKGLNYPNMFMRLERPRHLGGAALLASVKKEHAQASRLAKEARAYAEERGMRHLYPLTALIEGKVLSAAGEFEASLEAYERAEAEALDLGMRPIIWQARAGLAGVLASMGRMEEAETKRAAARAMILEIANSFENQDLREAFLRSALPKIP